MNKPIHFPEDFIWGAATAGHQIEGNNLNSDWWARENASDSKVSERSGDAADSYHRFREDIAILAESGLRHIGSRWSGHKSSRLKATSLTQRSRTTHQWWSTA